MQTGSGSDGPASDHGVYGISVAASLVGTGVQNLRAYERAGLLEPSRTSGGTRLYSQDDIDRLRRIDALLRAGLNLAGIAMVLSNWRRRSSDSETSFRQRTAAGADLDRMRPAGRVVGCQSRPRRTGCRSSATSRWARRLAWSTI